MRFAKAVIATLFVAALAVSAALAVKPAAQPPILLMIDSSIAALPGVSNFPETLDGAQAAVNAINKAGGIKGRMLKLLVCDNQGDANLDAACGRQAVAQNVVALVGGWAPGVGTHYSIVAAAGIPEIGPYPSSVESYTSPNSFPLIGGSLTATGGPAGVAADLLGAKRIVAFTNANSSSQATTVAGINRVLAPKNLTLTANIPVPPGTPDLSAYVQQALNLNPDAVLPFVAASDNDKLTAIFRQQYPNIAVARSATTLTTASLATLGSLAEGIYVTSQYLPASAASSNPGVARFVKELHAENPSALADDFSANSWAGVQVFAQAANKVKTITAKSIYYALSVGRVWNTFVGPPVAFIHPLAGPATAGTTFTRVFNADLTYNKVINGQVVNLVKNKFYNPFSYNPFKLP